MQDHEPGHEAALRSGTRLAALLEAWLLSGDAGRSDALARMLHPKVVWQGLQPELVCRGRTETLALLTRHIPRRLTLLEGRESGNRVAISVASPDFAETGLRAADEPRSMVFTFEGPLVVNIRSVPTPADAMAGLND